MKSTNGRNPTLCACSFDKTFLNKTLCMIWEPGVNEKKEKGEPDNCASYKWAGNRDFTNAVNVQKIRSSMSVL